MDKTRANTSGPLNRWNAHRAELTDKALPLAVTSEKVKLAFRNWVVKGENAPQYGDTLYDHLVCIENGLVMNTAFMFKTYELGDCDDVIYHDCILRTWMGNLAPGTKVPQLTMDVTTLTVREYESGYCGALRF